MHIYISNLSIEISEEELRRLFGRFGQVASATLIKDRQLKTPKGYGLVEMVQADQAERAILALDGKKLKGQPVRLSKHWPRL